MNDRLDQLVEQLAASPTDRSLDDLQAQVSRGVAKRTVRLRTAAALAPVRVASIGLALAIGVAAGGLAAASSAAAPKPSGAFTVAAALAPSTLLDRGQ
ncbi:MAG TPA: hypothetical protein VIJ94_04965 [Caulobacteraceae bacterium]